MEQFTPLKWQFKSTPNTSAPVTRQFFIKKHQIKSHQNNITPKIPVDGRTLLLNNVPPLLNTSQLKATLSNHFGLIEKIYLQDEPGKSGFEKYHNNPLVDLDGPKSETGIFADEVRRLDCYGCAYSVVLTKRTLFDAKLPEMMFLVTKPIRNSSHYDSFYPKPWISFSKYEILIKPPGMLFLKRVNRWIKSLITAVRRF